MIYLQVDYKLYERYAKVGGLLSIFMLYNYNAFFHNKNFAFVTKGWIAFGWLAYNYLYHKYRKQVLRCNLFDEYVQMRADELIKERTPILDSFDFKKWVWFAADMRESISRVHRQSYKNDATDFADSELVL